MSTSGVSPEHIVSSPHPIDIYYDHVFDAATATGEYFPYDATTGLEVSISVNYVCLTDPDIPSYKFAMSRVYTDTQTVLVFSVCNVIDSQRHPLLYPARLMERTVPLLEETGRVDAVQGLWLPPPFESQNYADYMQGLQRLAQGRMPTVAERKNAARGTWTGQLLSRLGYSAVRKIQVDAEGGIQAFFARPS